MYTFEIACGNSVIFTANLLWIHPERKICKLSKFTRHEVGASRWGFDLLLNLHSCGEKFPLDELLHIPLCIHLIDAATKATHSDTIVDWASAECDETFIEAIEYDTTCMCRLKETVACDEFGDHTIVFRIQNKDFIFLYLVKLRQHLAYSVRGGRDFSTIYEDFIGSTFQPCETAIYIRTLRENSILILGLSHRKISLCVFS